VLRESNSAQRDSDGIQGPNNDRNLPKNNHFHPLKVDLDGSCAGHTSCEAIGRELTGIVNNKVRLAKLGEFLFRGTDEHVVHEEGMICTGTDDADFDAVLWIPLNVDGNVNTESMGSIQDTHSSKPIEDIDVVTRVEVIDRSFSVDLKCV
jgi:hypothetical protein